MKWLINKAFLMPSVEQLLRLQADSWTSKTILLFCLWVPRTSSCQFHDPLHRSINTKRSITIMFMLKIMSWWIANFQKPHSPPGDHGRWPLAIHPEATSYHWYILWYVFGGRSEFKCWHNLQKLETLKPFRSMSSSFFGASEVLQWRDWIELWQPRSGVSKLFARRATCGEMNICGGRPFRQV